MSDQNSLDEIREQLEAFALHRKPGTTKGKHRTAIFDTLELAKLVQALLQQQQAAINKTIMECLPKKRDKNLNSSEWMNYRDDGYNQAIDDMTQAIIKKYGRADNEPETI